MDTPYRLTKLLTELSRIFKKSKILIGLDMTIESESYYYENIDAVLNQVKGQKRNFVLILYPKKK